MRTLVPTEERNSLFQLLHAIAHREAIDFLIENYDAASVEEDRPDYQKLLVDVSFMCFPFQKQLLILNLLL